jgi:hypothetical protein
MIICNYTGENYKDCLDLMLPTWKMADKIVIYSDTNKFGIKMFEPSDDFNESCRRKIQIIKRTLEDYKGHNVLYLDTDVMMMESIGHKVFTHDVVATRMVKRPDRIHGEKDINAGVSFWKANDGTVKFCEQWLEDEKKYQDFKYPEQHAFNELCYKYYDSSDFISIGNISERLYNFEHDNPDLFLKGIEQYKPNLIHFKGRRWGKADIVEKVKNIYK